MTQLREPGSNTVRLVAEAARLMAGAVRLMAEAAGPVVQTVWPGGCPGCGDPRGPVCPACTRRLTGGPLVWRQLGDGTPCVASTRYLGPVRALVLAAKEGGRRDVRHVLAHALARALVAVAWGESRQRAALLVVTPPSAMTTRWRRRGDPVADLARRAANLVRRSGAQVRTPGLLRHRRRVVDQAGLGADGRWANVSGAFAVRGDRLARLSGTGWLAAADAIVVDDVVTTAATASETVAVLRAAGVRVIGVAAVAAARG